MTETKKRMSQACLPDWLRHRYLAQCPAATGTGVSYLPEVHSLATERCTHLTPGPCEQDQIQGCKLTVHERETRYSTRKRLSLE